MKTIITTQYTDSFSVDFTSEAWFNATEVAKHYGKRPNDWLNLESTKEYMACLVEFHLPEKMVNKKNQLVITKTGKAINGGGSWFHPKLAVAFARWLDVRFSIWCDLQVEKILRQPISEPSQDGVMLFLKNYSEKERRFLVHTKMNAVQITPVPDDCYVMTYDDFIQCIASKKGVFIINKTKLDEITLKQLGKFLA